MIIGHRGLEKKINEIGFNTIYTCQDVITQLNISGYNKNISLEAGYRALQHRRKRLLNFYTEKYSCVLLDDVAVLNVKRYITNMMTKGVREYMNKPEEPKKNWLRKTKE